MSKRRLHKAQIEALRWLQSRVEDQFVRAYISNEIALLERIRYPINSSGKQISNHYELKDWDLFNIPEQEKADEWDGHTPEDVAKRIESYLGRK